MNINTKDYRFLVKLLAKEHVFSKKHCKTVAAQLLENKSFRGVTKHHRQCTAARMLELSFVWRESTEGFNYWYSIHCKLNKGISVHGDYIGTSDKEIAEALLIPF